MLSQVTAFVFGPFCYPIFFASFLHVVDVFVNFPAPKAIDSEPPSPFLHALGIDFELQPAGEPKEMK